MKTKLVMVGLFILLVNSPLSATRFRFNPMSSQWEPASPKAQLQYNPYNSEWLYVEPWERLEYNVYSDRYEPTLKRRYPCVVPPYTYQRRPLY